MAGIVIYFVAYKLDCMGVFKLIHLSYFMQWGATVRIAHSEPHTYNSACPLNLALDVQQHISASLYIIGLSLLYVDYYY